MKLNEKKKENLCDNNSDNNKYSFIDVNIISRDIIFYIFQL